MQRLTTILVDQCKIGETMVVAKYVHGFKGPIDVEKYSGKTLDVLMKEYTQDNRQGLFMPQLLILSRSISDYNFTGISLSHVIRGALPSGQIIDIYNHKPSILTNPEYVAKHISQLTSDGSIPFPEVEFARLLATQNSKDTFVVSLTSLEGRRNTAFYGGVFQAQMAADSGKSEINHKELLFDYSTTPRGKFLFFGNSPTAQDMHAILLPTGVITHAYKEI
jgi:hypothetical protein